MKTAVIIMSRIPEPGYTKTRLLDHLSGEECAALHRACLRDICRAVRCSGMPSYLYYTGSPGCADQTAWWVPGSELWGLPPEDYQYFTVRQQQGTRLGDRMLNAVHGTLPNHDAVIFVGSDMPCLTPELLKETVIHLGRHDLVFGPAEDGGYYLLALKKVYKELFADIPWSTTEVLSRSLAAAQSNSLSYSLLSVKRDIDTWEDLMSFYSDGLNNHEYLNMDSYQYAEYLVRKVSQR